MDLLTNPYAPGAGTPPPELAGRTDLINDGTNAIRRIAAGKPTQSIIMVGLRGVGKTVDKYMRRAIPKFEPKVDYD